MVELPRRRDVIRGIGVAGIAGLAGCGGDDGNGNGGNGGNGNGGNGNGNGGNGNGNGGNGNGDGGARTISLGLLMGVTGGLEELGPPIRDAAQLVSQQVNEADTDFEIDTQFEDTGTDPQQGISGAEALVNNGYPMICGALSSEVSLQVAQNVAVPNEIPMISPASTSPEITDLDDNNYVYRTCPTDALQGRALANIAYDRLDADTTATFFLNQAYGQGVDQGFTNAFENEQGGEVLNSVAFEPGGSSYT
jgi:ABC-type branched-subunit amino acid transport system substrate-binding protein